jgi:cytochrome c5
MLRSQLLVVVLASAVLLAACGKSSTPSPTPTTDPAQAEPPKAPPAASFNVTSIFPPGPGRDMVLNTCGSCHPVVCSARGQRTAERWESIKEGHKDKLTGASSADLNVMFSYLKANFNDTKPEPQIPAELLQQGCTPF